MMPPADPTPSIASPDNSLPAAWGRRRLLRGLAAWWPMVVRIIGIACGIGVIVVASQSLVRHRMTTIQEVDSQGYYLMARAFGEGQWPRWADDIARFRGHVWVDVADGLVATKYSPGGPLLMAVGYRAYGYDGVMWVNVVLAIIGLVAFFLLAWDLFGSVPAAICTFVWAFSPMLLYYGQYPLAHSAEICVVILAMLFAVRWGRTGSVFFAIAAGFCAGYLPLIRATTVLLIPAIFTAYWVTGGKTRLQIAAAGLTPERIGWRRVAMGILVQWRLLLAIAAMVIPLSFLAYFNTTIYGRPWRTGYHFSNEDGAFDWAQWPLRVHALIQQRGYLLEDAFWIACALGLWLRAGRSGIARMLALWALPTIALYIGYYYFSPSPRFLRFFLPSVAAIVLCIGLPFQRGILAKPTVQLLMLAMFALLMWYRPSSYFAVRSNLPERKALSVAAESYQSQQSLLGVDNRAAGPLSALLSRSERTSVYGPESLYWNASIRPNIDAYDIDAWTDRHFVGRPAECPDAQADGVYHDPARHRRMHQFYATRSATDLLAHFEQHIKHQLQAGRTVLVQLRSNSPLLQRMIQSPDLQATSVPNDLSDIWNITAREQAAR